MDIKAGFIKMRKFIIKDIFSLDDIPQELYSRDIYATMINKLELEWVGNDVIVTVYLKEKTNNGY